MVEAGLLRQRCPEVSVVVLYRARPRRGDMASVPLDGAEDTHRPLPRA
jgi:hypothetical protein